MKYPTREQLQALSGGDRLRLIEDLWATFVDDPNSLALSEGHAQEIDRRVAEWERDPGSGEPWTSVRQRITKD